MEGLTGMKKLILASLLGLAVAACGGANDPQTATSPTSGGSDQQEAAVPASDDSAPKKAAVPASGDSEQDGAGVVASGESDTERAVVVMKSMVAVMKDMANAAEGAGDDCDTMAAALDEVLEANKGALEAAQKFSKEMKAKQLDREESKEMASRLEPAMKEMGDVMKKLIPAMMKCGDNEKMKAVQEKFNRYLN